MKNLKKNDVQVGQELILLVTFQPQIHFRTWMGGCQSDAKNAKKSAKFQKNLNGFMARMLSYFNRCSKRNDGGELGVNPEFNDESDNGFR